MLNKSGESEHPCFVPDLTGKAFGFPLRIMLVVVFSDMAFITLKYFSSIINLLRTFIMKRC
jgi:hypothetical protein